MPGILSPYLSPVEEMHNSINGTAGMTPEATMAQSGGYGTDGWASISPYSQSPYGNSPMNEYANWNSYMPPTLPSESIGRMQPPPPQTPQPHQHQLIQPAPSTPRMGHQQHHHQQLPMLNTTWPSQLTNPTPTGSYSAPPLSITPVSAARTLESPRPLASLPAPPPPPPPPPPAEKSRKTLSTEQKRAMCIYFEENPGTRQADIGAKFGVERRYACPPFSEKGAPSYMCVC